MKKGNIRSIRFSDELLEIIDQQIGDNFTQKFERLVYNCYMLLPERQKELERIESSISRRRRDLENLANRYNSAAGCLRSFEHQMQSMQRNLENLAGFDKNL